MSDPGQPAYVFQANQNEAVGIRLSNWKGTQRVDIRKYVADINTGELIATRKGLSIALDHFPAVRKAVKAISNVMTYEKVVAKIRLGDSQEILGWSKSL